MSLFSSGSDQDRFSDDVDTRWRESRNARTGAVVASRALTWRTGQAVVAH